MGRVLDLIFPLECIGCGSAGAHACAGCLAAIRPSPKSFADGAMRSVAGFSYAQPFVRRLLHDAKYEGWTCALGPIRTLARRFILAHGGSFPAEAAVAAVPLHPARLQARGFNQAEALGQEVAAASGRKTAFGYLARARRTRPQTGTDDRMGNVRGAFICRDLPAALRGRPFLLVDDVLTSGATMRECAEALRRAGSGAVYGLALAWGDGKGKDEAEAPPSVFT